MRRFVVFAALAGGLGLSAGCELSGEAPPETRPKRQARLYGGGATFLNPMMQKWIAEYEQKTGRKVSYQSLGSGAGIEHTTTKAFDFGGTESALNEKQLKRAEEIGGEILHIPVCMGAVVPTYNLPGVERPLRFTPKLLADIFLGHVRRWDDPAILEVNSGLELPAEDIAIVHRSDGSGTTFVWVDYLSKVSAEWDKKVGRGTTVKWPVGTGQRGNEGVAGHIAQTPYTLGYNELTTAVNRKLQYGIVQNRDGVFVRPSLEAVTAAAEGALRDIPDDLRYTITNMPGKDAYPISGSAWVILYANQRPDKAKALSEFLHWVTHDGQVLCDQLQYARLPAGLVQRVELKLAKIKGTK
jgi:phosphate transport system substrate-binding protein